MLRRNWSAVLLAAVLAGLLLLPLIARGGEEKEHDKQLLKATKHLRKIVKQDGPESIEFPWDADKHKIDDKKEPPDFTSYYARTVKIGEDPKIRTDGDSITSTIFVGTKKVGQRFKVENWRVFWEKKGDHYVATSRQVIQSFDEFYAPFHKKEVRQSKAFLRSVFEFGNMQFEHDRMRFSVPKGRLVLIEADGKPFAGYITGKGELSYDPPTQLASNAVDSDRETQQFKHHLETDRLDGCGFSNAVVWGHPNWMRAFLDRLELRPVESQDELQREARDAFFERLLPIMRGKDLAFGGSEYPICILPDSRDFLRFEFDTPKHDLLSYTFDPSSIREISLCKRSKQQMSKRKFKWFKTVCEYDESGQRKEKTLHQLQHESKDSVKTVSWSADVRFERGMLDKVKKGKFEIIFEYETLKPNATVAMFDFSALNPTALTDAGGNDMLFFDMGSELLVPVDPVDCPAGRMNVLFAEGREPGDIDWTHGYMDGWLPGSGYLDCKAFELKITVPEKFQVTSVGKLLEEQVHHGYRTKHWVGEHCTRFPGFVIGELFILDGEAGGKPIVIYSKDNAQARKYVLPEIESSLTFYAKCFGEYPYSKLSVCPVNWSHGRGFASLVTITGRHGLLGDAQPGLYCHEVSHQWWGNIVGWFSPADQWLSEGFAEMSTLMYLQSARDNDSVKGRLKDWAYSAKKLDEKGPICLGATLDWAGALATNSCITRAPT